MNKSAFSAKLVSLSESGNRERIVGAIMAGDDRTPLASSAWRQVVLPLLQGDAAASKLSSMPAGKHAALLSAFKVWVSAVSKPGKGGPMSADTAALKNASAAFEALDSSLGKAAPSKRAPSKRAPAKKAAAPKKAASRKKPAARKPAPKKAAPKKAASRKKPAARKPASRKKPAARKPASRKPASRKAPAPKRAAARKAALPKGSYRVRLDLTFEEL